MVNVFTKTVSCAAVATLGFSLFPTAAVAGENTEETGSGPQAIARTHEPKTEEWSFAAADTADLDRSRSRSIVDRSSVVSASLHGLATIGVTWKQQDMNDADAVPTIQLRSYNKGLWSDWVEIPANDEDAGLTGVSPSYYIGEGDTVEARITAKTGQTIDEAKLIIVDSGYSVVDDGSVNDSADGQASREQLQGRSVSRSVSGIDNGSMQTMTGRIHTREEWWVKGNPKMDWTPQRTGHWQGAIVHHTVDRNNYTKAEVPAMINGIYLFHNLTRGWGDVGYQMLVDRFGGIWEGRDEGIPNRMVPASQVVGAQSRGFNAATFGVSMIGDFQSAAPSTAAIDSVAAAIAWQFDALGIHNSHDTFQYKGTQARITGHGDRSHWSDSANITECPGQQVWNRMGHIRDVVGGDLAYMASNRSTAHLEDVQWMMNKGIAQGYGPLDLFGGLRTMKRQDMAAFLYRLAGSPQYTPNWSRNPFQDVNAGTPHAKEILWLASTGIATGWNTSAGKEYRGDQSVARQDMAAFLNRFAAFRGDTGASQWKPVNVSAFTDVDESTPHQREILWLSSRGISTGFGDGTFRGRQTLIRQDMAAFLHREMRYLGN